VRRLHRDNMELLHLKASMARRLRKASTEHHHHKVNMAHHRRKVNMVHHLLKVNMGLLHLSKVNTPRHRLRDSTELHHLKASMVHLLHRDSMAHHHKVNTARHSPDTTKLHHQAAVSAVRLPKHHSATVPSELPTLT
jgi:hypothetical protein